jgi:DNA-binding protein YbaB
MGDKLGRLAEDLRRTGDELRQVVDGMLERHWAGEASDGSVRVVVDGRCRVTKLYLSPYLLRHDPGVVGELVTAATNDALRQARAGRQQALLDSLPPAVRGSAEETVEQARRDADR